MSETISQSFQTDLKNPNIIPEEYGTDYRDHVLEQYKLYMETAENTSNRRHQANAFYLSFNTLAATAIGVLYDKGLYIAPRWLVFLPLMVLATVSFSWLMLIKSYRELNRAKFQVIDEFEIQFLPARPFVSSEWRKYLGKQKKNEFLKGRIDFSLIEQVLPIAFIILYIAIGIAYCFLLD